MTNSDPEHRAYHQPTADHIEIRDVDDSEEGLMSVRMPISSTAEARDGDAFDVERLRGWRRQINEGDVPVFLDHGRNIDVSGSRYSSAGKVGVLRNAELEERESGQTDLVVDNVLMDPETLPPATGGLREQLARIKAQVQREIPLSASVGWADETGDRDLPGGSDLLESSLVGIPSDPSATQGAEAAATMARAALDSRGDDVDAEALVDEFRSVVMGSLDSDRGDYDSADADQGGNARDSVTDSDTDESGDTPDDTNDDQDGISAEEFRSEMLEMQRNQSETLSMLADALREDDDDEDEDEDDDEDDDEMSESSADEDASDDRTITVGDEELTADDVRALREQLDDAEPDVNTDDDDGERDADTDDDAQSDDQSDPLNLL